MLMERLDKDLSFVLNENNRRWVIVDDEALSVLGKKKLSESEKKIFKPFFDPANFRDISGRLFIVYHMTNSCNYRCKYCYANAGKGHSLSLSDAFGFIDNLKENDWGFDKYAIEFHGGEPLLEFEKIKKIVDYAKESGLDLRFDMQTNASLIDDEVCDFIKENKIGVGVSIDGPKLIHDKQRVKPNGEGTFDETMNGIKKLKEHNIKFGIISVATKITWEHKEDYFNFLVEEGLNSFSLNPMYPFGRGSKAADLLISDEQLLELYLFLMEKISRYNEGIKDKKKMIKFRNVDIIFSILKNQSYYYRCMHSPCGAGRDMLALGPDGNIYPCEEFVGDKRFILGKYNSQPQKIFYNKIVSEIKEKTLVDNNEDCSKCAFKFICGGGCSAKRFYCSGGLDNKDVRCYFNKELIKYLLKKAFYDGWKDGFLLKRKIERDKEDKKVILLKGNPISPYKAEGFARVISNEKDLLEIKDDEIVVITDSTPVVVPFIIKAKGFVGERGGFLSHLAIVSREFEKACVNGIKEATRIINTGDFVIVDGVKGLVRVIKG